MSALSGDGWVSLVWGTGTKHRHVYLIVYPGYWLAIQSLPDSQRQNFSGRHVGSDESVGVAGKANDVGYDSEKRIRVNKGCVGFAISQLDRSPRFPGSHLRSPALLPRLCSRESKLQHERCFPGLLMSEDNYIDISISDLL